MRISLKELFQSNSAGTKRAPPTIQGSLIHIFNHSDSKTGSLSACSSKGIISRRGRFASRSARVLSRHRPCTQGSASWVSNLREVSQDLVAAWLGITLEPPIQHARRTCEVLAFCDSCGCNRQQQWPGSLCQKMLQSRFLPRRLTRQPLLQCALDCAGSTNSIGGCGTRWSRCQVSTLRPLFLPCRIGSIRYLRQ